MTNNLKILCAMGKKKKTYVRPEMKIIEVKTEGVIAASGGETIIDPELICSQNNLFDKGCNGINDCTYTTEVANCNQVTKEVFENLKINLKTCSKDGKAYHIDYNATTDKLHIYPCNCKKH